jgi:hypothetical protein
VKTKIKFARRRENIVLRGGAIQGFPLAIKLAIAEENPMADRAQSE